MGFPGETEQDFEETLSLVEECGFDGAFTFVYSPPRADGGGEAAGTGGARRGAKSAWRDWWNWCSAWARRANRGPGWATVEVMVERASRQRAGEVMGRTRGHKPVNFASRRRPGDLVMVELLEATSTSFRGRQRR